jgi:hypothetical protein
VPPADEPGGLPSTTVDAANAGAPKYRVNYLGILPEHLSCTVNQSVSAQKLTPVTAMLPPRLGNRQLAKSSTHSTGIVS